MSCHGCCIFIAARRGAALSLLQPRDRCHLQAKRASTELNTKLSGALTSCPRAHKNTHAHTEAIKEATGVGGQHQRPLVHAGITKADPPLPPDFHFLIISARGAQREGDTQGPHSKQHRPTPAPAYEQSHCIPSAELHGRFCLSPFCSSQLGIQLGCRGASDRGTQYK